MVDVGRPLDSDDPSMEVYDQPVQVYTDGEAAHPADPRMRRSGWGIRVQEEHPLNNFGVVPGPEQTA